MTRVAGQKEVNKQQGQAMYGKKPKKKKSIMNGGYGK